MIDVRELRIGSHFHIGGVWRRVTGMNGHTGRLVGRMLDKDGKVCDDVYRAEDIEPIPITEELLAELGFEGKMQFGNWVWYKQFGNYLLRSVYKSSNQWDFSILVARSTCRLSMCRKLQFLHELEAMVYLTTKTELIKD